MSLLTNGRPITELEANDSDLITFEEFLRRHMGEHVEWVGGKVVAMAPISDAHADVADFLQMLLRHWVEAGSLGIVRSEPVLMKVGAGLPGRSPDVLFVAQENLGRVKETYIDGPADVAVEVISPESRSRDRGEKFYEYEQGGVREHWLIDPARKQAEFHQRGDDGIYRGASPDAQGIYRSVVIPGLWLKVDWLWQRPMPTVLSVLREWKLV